MCWPQEAFQRLPAVLLQGTEHALTKLNGCLASHTWGQILMVFARFGSIRGLLRDVIGAFFLLQVRNVNPHTLMVSSVCLGGPRGGLTQTKGGVSQARFGDRLEC